MSLTEFREREPKRIVIDTNVLISAEISAQGVSGRLVDRVLVEHHVVLSYAILEELDETLENKFGYSATAVSEVTDQLLSAVEIVEPVTFDRQICRDPDDDTILGTAVAGNADCIVTGDSDLLVLERFQGVDVVSPSEFARYESESQS